MPPLSVMIKPASSLCNLRCKYCFYHDVSTLRETESFGVMDAATSEKLICDTLSFADGESVAFAFQGGEPLLAGNEYFRHFCSFVKEKNIKNSPVFFSVQTNGMLVDDSWARFFAENGFLVGLSLDGDYESNSFRVTAQGDNSYYRIMSAAKKLKKHGAEFNILCVLTGRCADNCEKIYKFFRSEGFGYLQFIPCLRPFGSAEESELYPTARQYADFLIRIFNLYAKDYYMGRYVSIRQFDNWVRLYLGEGCEQCGMGGHCTHQAVIEGNGNVYPCDFYCTDEWLLGNIGTLTLREMLEGTLAESFIKQSLILPERCRGCKFYPLCRGGGCKRNRADRDYCESYKRFFSECLPLFSIFKNATNQEQ